MHIQIEGETLDKYLGFHYYVNAISNKSKHKLAYVAVGYNDKRVAGLDFLIRQNPLFLSANSI
jgi:hypothetical protein